MDGSRTPAPVGSNSSHFHGAKQHSNLLCFSTFRAKASASIHKPPEFAQATCHIFIFLRKHQQKPCEHDFHSKFVLPIRYQFNMKSRYGKMSHEASMIASECVIIIVWKGARWVVSRDLYISEKEKLGGHLTSPSQKGQQKIASFRHFAFSLSPSFAVSKLTVFLLRPCPCCKRCREDMQLLEDTCERERIQRNELNRHLSIRYIFYTILSTFKSLVFQSLSHFFRCENTRRKLSSKVTSESQGDKHQVLQLLNRYWIAFQGINGRVVESCWPISPKKLTL